MVQPREREAGDKTSQQANRQKRLTKWERVERATRHSSNPPMRCDHPL